MYTAIPRPIRLAQLLLGWCCVLVYAVMVVCTMPFYARNSGLAAGYALSRAGLTSAEVDVVLDALLALYRPQDDLDANVLAVYRAAQAMADVPENGVGAIGSAWQHPQASPKSLLASLKYAPNRDKAREAFALMDVDVALSPQQWQATGAGVVRASANVAALGEDKCVEFVHIVRRMRQATHFADQISYKDMRKAADAVLAYTEGVQFATLYVLDLVLGEGTCAAVGADVDYLLGVLRGLRYDRLMDIAGELPNRTLAVYRLARYLFVEQGASVETCRVAVAHLAARFDLPQVLSSPVLWQELAWLSMAPAAPTEDEWSQIATHVDTLWSAIAPREAQA